MKNFIYLIIGLIIGYLACLLLNQFSETKDVEVMAVVKPKGIITDKEARILDQNFDSRHRLISDSILSKPDNRSSWYALQDIQNYLKYAEQTSDSLGYKMNGIRVYLGAHGPADYTTMFLIPTGYKNGGMLPQKAGDLPGVGGLNDGDLGNPPQANYPQ